MWKDHPINCSTRLDPVPASDDYQAPLPVLNEVAKLLRRFLNPHKEAPLKFSIPTRSSRLPSLQQCVIRRKLAVVQKQNLNQTFPMVLRTSLITRQIMHKIHVSYIMSPKKTKNLEPNKA
ncbi:hypothetical protein NC651_025653 [Populus alba x Populus x berolinensis]|nr:hypothetical protein NC651_025653 [Populus alba x Populus x berolinensis]